jgi:hypothetical protein
VRIRFRRGANYKLLQHGDKPSGSAEDFFHNVVTTDYLNLAYIKALYRTRLMFAKNVFRPSRKFNLVNSKNNRFDGIAESLNSYYKKRSEY